MNTVSPYSIVRSRLCVVVLTKNEEQRIEQCIRSVGPFAPVIVVDSGSDDSTVEVAASCGARVLLNVPDGTFIIGDQRNWALDALKREYEWVLFLDADERATSAFLEEVSNALQASSNSTDGFWAAPKFIYKRTWLKRYMGYPNWHCRLVRARTRLVGGIWETFPQGGNYGFINEPYLHYPDDRGLAHWLQRHYRYALARVNSQEMGAKPARKRLLRWLSDRLGPLRPWLRVAYPLFIRGGCLDGPDVWSYARRSLIYELLISELQCESREHGGVSIEEIH